MRHAGTVGAVLITLVLAALFVMWVSAPGKTFPARTETVMVAYSPFESGALFWIAKDRYYFGKNGINLTLKKYDSGAGSIDGVLNGDADMAVAVTEFPLVRKSFTDAPVRTIAVMDRGYFTYLVARRDRGIVNVSDLRGKKVGTTIGTIAEFHLGRFLTLHGMNMGDVTLVDLKSPDDWVRAVASGEIDAISTAQPYAGAAREQLGDNAVIWPVQSGQPLYALVLTTDGWLGQHPDTATGFLRALAEAEDFSVSDPEEARTIVQRSLDLDPGYMDTVWSQNQFALTLDQSLVTAMEDEGRWMIRNNMTNASTIPDFTRFISPGSLQSVKPGSVNIIR